MRSVGAAAAGDDGHRHALDAGGVTGRASDHEHVVDPALERRRDREVVHRGAEEHGVGLLQFLDQGQTAREGRRLFGGVRRGVDEGGGEAVHVEVGERVRGEVAVDDGAVRVLLLPCVAEGQRDGAGAGTGARVEGGVEVQQGCHVSSRCVRRVRVPVGRLPGVMAPGSPVARVAGGCEVGPTAPPWCTRVPRAKEGISRQLLVSAWMWSGELPSVERESNREGGGLPPPSQGRHGAPQRRPAGSAARVRRHAEGSPVRRSQDGEPGRFSMEGCRGARCARRTRGQLISGAAELVVPSGGDPAQAQARVGEVGGRTAQAVLRPGWPCHRSRGCRAGGGGRPCPGRRWR